jgi:hypothetical protein
MKITRWPAVAALLMMILAAGCYSNAPSAPQSKGPLKVPEQKSSVGRGGLENPPPP